MSLRKSQTIILENIRTRGLQTETVIPTMVRAVPRCFLYRYYTVADTYHNPLIARNKCLALCRTVKSQTVHYSALSEQKPVEINNIPAAAIQKLKCLQIGDPREINNSWQLELDKINHFTIHQPRLGNKKSNPRSKTGREKTPPPRCVYMHGESEEKAKYFIYLLV